MSTLAYWRDALDAGIEEADANLTEEQRAVIARVLDGAYDTRDMAFGPTPPPPEREELKRIKRDLAIERSKVGCRECNGTGRIISNDGFWRTDTQCNKCGGNGKHVP